MSESRRATTREILGTIALTLQVADLIALMMVFAAAMSAYATWKTTQITNEILLTSQRPYIGTQSINLIAATSPRLVVELRNFGSVQAERAMISVVLIVNGKALPLDSEPQRQQSPVVLSPGVPHRFYRHLSTDIYRDAVQGKADLAVEIDALSGSAGRRALLSCPRPLRSRRLFLLSSAWLVELRPDRATRLSGATRA